MSDFATSDMEKWLRRENISTTDFAKRVGCSRNIIYKVKDQVGICKKFAEKIKALTNGEINPLISAVGRSPKLKL